MQSLQIFLANFPGMIWSIAASGLYAASTLALGSRLAPQCRPGWEGLDVAIHFALGAAAFGLLFAVLAMLQVAFPAVILALALLPALLALLLSLYQSRAKLRSFTIPTHFRPRPGTLSAARITVVFGIVLIAAYALAQSLAWPRGSDMTIYHLVIPRTILWNNGLIFNPFSHDAGLFYGWQLYALPAYLMGGDRAFQLCSFIALAMLLLSTYRVLQVRYGTLTGLLGALVAVAVICGMSRESVVNNDIPLVLLEIALLGLACIAVPQRAAAWALGLLGGFTIAVKLVALPTVGLAYAIFLWRAGRPLQLQWGAMLAAASVISLGPWPLFNYLSSGSPLPHFLLLWPPETGYLPHYRESIIYLMQYFGESYQKNFSRLFSQGLEFVPVLLLGNFFLLFVKSTRADPLCLALAAFALLKTLLLLAMNGFDAALLFHDRYHLASYVLLTLGGMLCWFHAIRPALPGRPMLGTVVLPALILISTLHLYRTHVSAVQVNGRNLADSATTYPSLENGFYSAVRRLAEIPGGGGGGIGYDFAAELLPPHAVVATTVIDPYLLQRPFLQMLPVSENVIDLALPPEQLRQAMITHGATHLHLSQHTGLNPWMVPVVDQSLKSLRSVPGLPGVRRLLYLNYPTQKGLQGFYELAAGKPSDNVGLQQLREMRLTQEIDGTWTVRWRRERGGDVRVNLHLGYGQTALLGEAASEMGQFPIRLNLPAATTLEVVCSVGGQIIQTLSLPVPTAKN
ncbi:MAG: hypothetical protein SGI92_12835 [Bryobacteraceae bacterium]|nr:hypothetical protein [Bryobacteraceae bacterium]